MEFLQPETWQEALQMKAAHPQAVPIQGGTDVMVELNFDRHRPEYLLDLTRVGELAEWAPDNGRIRLGAGVTYTRVITELGDRLPGLAMASRTVGSPQIRNRGTVGGNLGAASPAGDSHPALLAACATVEAESARGARRIPAEEFYTGVKRNALRPDELIKAVLIARPARSSSARSAPATRWSSPWRRSAWPCTPIAGPSAPASGRRPPRRAGRWPRNSSSRSRWPMTACGSHAAPCPTPPAGTSPTWSRTPPPRSTTSAAPHGTASIRCPSWPGAR